jgi:hypothetical protein
VRAQSVIMKYSEGSGFTDERARSLALLRG